MTLTPKIDEHPIDILRAVEQLVLLAFGPERVLLLVAQGDKAVGLAPTFRLIAELALLVGIRALPGSWFRSTQGQCMWRSPKRPLLCPSSFSRFRLEQLATSLIAEN